MNCPICGTKMEKDDEGLWYCWKCDRTFWYNPFTKNFEEDDYVVPGPDKEAEDDMEWSDL